MSVPRKFYLPQDREAQVVAVSCRQFHYRFAYARSTDSRMAEEPGQDYLAIQEDGRRLAFALCDGVSQSFMGDLAALLLGKALVQWLWEVDLQHATDTLFHSELHAFLCTLVEFSSAQVARFKLPTNLPVMHRDVLEQKRRFGSRSLFCAGLLDTHAERLVIAWMGDSRFRYWTHTGEQTKNLGNTFHKEDQWSTNGGPVRNVYTKILLLEEIDRFVAYSDGLATLDRRLSSPPSNRALDETIHDVSRLSNSDDVSYIEVRLGTEPFIADSIALPAPRVNAFVDGRHLQLAYSDIVGATGYEVEFRNGHSSFKEIKASPWIAPLDEVPSNLGVLRVRAWAGEEPGLWSNEVKLPGAEQRGARLPIVDQHDPIPAVSRPFVAMQSPAQTGRTYGHRWWAVLFLLLLASAGVLFANEGAGKGLRSWLGGGDPAIDQPGGKVPPTAATATIGPSVTAIVTLLHTPTAVATKQPTRSPTEFPAIIVLSSPTPMAIPLTRVVPTLTVTATPTLTVTAIPSLSPEPIVAVVPLLPAAKVSASINIAK